MELTQHPKGESYLLQCLDSNCNDCKFMIRDSVRYNEKLSEVRSEQERQFNLAKKRLIESGSAEAIKEASKMKLQLSSKINEGFGTCSKFNKPVDFIPSICLIHTQECFVHRKDVI